MTESVFLVVDSDPGDLATFTSALTSRYGSEYKIRTAATASEAHTTLAALSDAGITVALLIVSRELVEADLFLLLKRARELFPGARKVLSARYVDPSAFEFITGAMRSGRIDYFLYKPCEPVGARLYPVVDDLLGGAHPARQERGFEAIRIIGGQWHPRSHQLRDLLERSTIPFGRSGGRRTGWVFPSKRARSGHLTTIALKFRQARVKAGLSRDLVLYCGRHDFGTRVLKKTGNLKLVMQTMGQKDVKTAMKYQHPELDIVRAALNETAPGAPQTGA